MSMNRVTKSHPCPVCQKPDWCLIGRSLVICMRVLSPRQKVFRDGSVGYIHSQNGEPVRIEPNTKPAEPIPDMVELFLQMRQRTSRSEVANFAESLGVTYGSLNALGCCQYRDDVFAFPMFNASQHLVGIRLRSKTGRKWAIKGSHQGLFIPNYRDEGTVFLPEGPTSTAAALSMGVHAIGRPSCNGAIYEIRDAVRRMKFRRAVIVADTDTDFERGDGSVFNPGLEGAELLATHLGIPSCTLLLPCKDMREFLLKGGSSTTLDYLVKQCVWRNP